MARKALIVLGIVLGENVNLILSAVGFVALLRGIEAFSLPAAWIVFGVVTMAIGLWPYLLATLRKRT